MEMIVHPPRRIILPLILISLASFLLQGCSDSIAPGYVNRLPYSITIIEDGETKRPLTLEPNQNTSPGFGNTPRSISVLTSTGTIIFTYQMKKPSMSGKKPNEDFYDYVVIDSNGAHFESKPTMLQNDSDQIR